MAKVGTGAAGIVFNYVSGSQAPTVVYNHVAQLVSMGLAQVMSFGTGTSGSYVSNGAGFVLASLNTNLNSWVRFRMINEPNLREYCVQLLNNGSGRANNVTINYSRTGGFVGGSPAAAVMPTAADSAAVCTNLTNAFGDAQSLRINLCAQNTLVNGVNPWVLQVNLLGSTTSLGNWVHDAIIAGSYDGTDPDPCAQAMNTTWGGSTVKFWTGVGTGNVTYNTVTADTTQGAFNGAKAVDPTSLKDVAKRFEYGTGVSVWKGISYALAVKGQARAYPNNFNKASDNFTYVGAAAAGILVMTENGIDRTL